MTENNNRIIALAGKGGVGKTSLAAGIVMQLTKRHPGARILAIDADPAVGLSTALGIEVETTIDDIRKEVIATVENGETKSAIELLGEAKYRLYDAITEAEGFDFIAVGRPESAGCYCSINSYLKEVISILSENFDYVVIDGEAGIEQINRRVMEKVTDLLLVTDASRKGTQVVQTIKNVADQLVMYDRAGVILNRVPDASIRFIVDVGDLEILACIESDPELAAFDIRGDSLLGLPEDDRMLAGVSEVLEKMEI